MKKHNTQSRAKETHPASPNEGSPKEASALLSRSERAWPTLIFVNVGKKRLEVCARGRGSLESNQKQCDYIWKVA